MSSIQNMAQIRMRFLFLEEFMIKAIRFLFVNSIYQKRRNLIKNCFDEKPFFLENVQSK